MGVADEQRFQRSAARKKPVSRQAYQGPQNDFINLELNKEHTAAYRLWRDDVDNVFALWTELVEGGYRTNVKWDDYSNSCAAFIIPGGESVNDGFILTGRGGTPYRALAEAIYKHYEMLHGEWASAGEQGGRASDPDF